MDEGARKARRTEAIGLWMCGGSITLISLAGPLLLALGRPLDPILPLIPVFWAVAIAGALTWRQAFRRRHGRERADEA